MPLVAQPVAHGTRAAYLRGCHCKRCQRANAVYQSELRARRRGLTPVPALAEPVSAVASAAPEPAVTAADAAPGPCVSAVRAELAALDLDGHEGLVAAAVCMAHILDSPNAVTTQPSACRQLTSLLKELHKLAEPRRGRLQAVENMTKSRTAPRAT